MNKEDEEILNEVLDKVIEHLLWTKIVKACAGINSEDTKEFYKTIEIVKKRRNPTFYDMVVDKIFKKPQLLITYNF